MYQVVEIKIVMKRLLYKYIYKYFEYSKSVNFKELPVLAQSHNFFVYATSCITEQLLE